MLEMLGTPSMTRTSPGDARLCASNSAILLTCVRAPSSGLIRCTMLRTVSAGPAMVRLAIVGFKIDAPMTPLGTPSSSIASEMTPVGSPIASSRCTAPSGGRGTFITLIRSAAIRPVNRLSAALMSITPSIEFDLRVADHDCQSVDLLLQESTEFRRRIASDLGALLDDLGARVRITQNLDGGGMQCRNHGVGRLCRSEQAEPSAGLVRHAEFDKCRNIREQCETMVRRDCDRPDASAADQSKYRQDTGKQHLHVVADDRIRRRGTAPIGDVQHPGAGDEFRSEEHTSELQS